MRRLFFSAAITLQLLSLNTTVAGAGDLDTMEIATHLGSVLASENACGLAYDQAAIAAFIEKKVPADDLGFPSMLTTMTSGAQYEIEGMSPSQKTAHCAQIKRIAKSYGFTH